MKSDLFYVPQQAVKYWWISILVGILAIGVGIWSLFTPLSTFVALTMVFAVTFLVNGIFEVIFTISNRKVLKNWGWTLLSSILDLIFGIILITTPVEITGLFLTYFVGFWAMFQSIWAIGSAAELQHNKVEGAGWLMAFAILGVIMSFAFIMSPVCATSFIIALVGISFISYGFFRIYLGIKYKSLDKKDE